MNHTEDRSNENVAIEASGIVKSFDTVRVLEGVDLSIPSETLTVLIGPNGSGKTTLLGAIVGLIEVDQGTISRRNRASDRSLGYLPQRPTFRPGFTVEETLSFYASLLGTDSSETGAILREVGLSQAKETKVEALSGGMTRLLGLAQAMLGNPSTVILDEPASGLDPGMREHVFEIALSLTDDDTGVLLTSHDLDLVDRFADRVALLHRGKITYLRRSQPEHEGDENTPIRESYATITGGSTRSIRVRRADQ